MTQSGISWRIQRLAATASTNDDVKRAAEAGEAEGLAVWALKQTAGRGRHGRQWESPEGNLYASMLLRPQCEARELGHYSFIAGLAVHDAVQSILPAVAITLKWPNDVLVQNKKIAGILLEAAPAQKDKIGWLVIGAGLNVAYHPSDVLYPTTSLLAEGVARVELSDILERLLVRLAYWQDVLKTQGFEPVLAAWWDRAERGKLSVRLPRETLEGTFSGIDPHGNLRLRLADGSERAIASGDVFLS